MFELDELKTKAARGWALFPCHSIQDGVCSCGDLDCASPGKHPRIGNGVKGATTDMNQIRDWVTRWPDANWALATGEKSGVWVLDIDVKGDGQRSLEKWMSESHVVMPTTYVVSTGGGGWHYYFGYTEPVRNKVRVLAGIDVRGDGGYVLLPGANHISGGAYSVARDVQPALADERLVSLARSDASRPAPTSSNSGTLLDPIPEGERDDTLFRMACSLRRTLKDNREAIELLVVERARRSGFPEADALRKVDQAFQQDHSDVLPDIFGGAESRLNLQTATEVRKRPRPTYLIDGVLPEGALFQAFGQTGSYKSFVMLDMLGSVANGIPWMGHPVTLPGPVAFILGEGGYDAGLRMDAWLAAHPGCTDERITYSIEEQLDLMNEGLVDRIIEDLEAYRAERFTDEPWRLIIFDTQADHMPSGDEDKSRDFTVMKRAIQRIAHETGASVGLVHHTGWDDSRERGSSRQRQALDVVMQVRAQRITNIKQKAGAKFEPIDFGIEPFGESIVVKQIGPIEAASDTMDADLEVGRGVITYLADNPGASQNTLQQELRLGRSGTWPKIRDLLDQLGLLQVTKDGKGSVRSVKPTDRGLAFYGVDPAP